MLAALGSRSRDDERRRRSSRWLALAAAILALLGFGLAVVPEASRRHLATLLSGPSDLSGQYRLDVAGATLRLALSRPFLGWGLGAYADAFPAFKRGHGEVRTTHAESDMLEFLAEGGLLGALLAAALGVAVWRGLAQPAGVSRDAERNGLALGAMAAAGALLVHSLFDFNLRLPANALAFASLWAWRRRRARSGRSHGGRTAALAIGALALVLAAGSAWRAWGALRLQRALAASDDAAAHRRARRRARRPSLSGRRLPRTRPGLARLAGRFRRLAAGPAPARGT